MVKTKAKNRVEGSGEQRAKSIELFALDSMARLASHSLSGRPDRYG
jgi:hypothetical protein